MVKSLIYLDGGCSGVSQLRCKNDYRGKYEIGVEKCSLLQARTSSVQHISERYSAETLTLLQNDVVGEELRVFFGDNPKRVEGNYMDQTIMSIARFDVFLATLISSLVREEKRGGQLQKKYADMYQKMVKAATSHIIVNAGGF